MNTLKIKITRTIIPIVLVANVMVFTSCSNKANQEINNTAVSSETLQSSDATRINLENIITNDIKIIDPNINDQNNSHAVTKLSINSDIIDKSTSLQSEALHTEYIKVINIDDNAKYYKKGEKITLDLNVGWLEDSLDGCSAAEISLWQNGVDPTGQVYKSMQSYLIKKFSDTSYEYKIGKKPSKKIKITISKPFGIGYGTINISLDKLKNISDAGTDNTHGYCNDDVIYYVADEFGNIIIAHGATTSVNGESLSDYKLLASDHTLLIYSRKKLLDEGKITQEQYDRELFLITRGINVYSYDIIDKISGYKNKIDLDDNGTDETYSFIETTAKNGYEKKMTISLKTSDGKKSSISINYLKTVRIYENHCIDSGIYKKSFNYYSISAETTKGKYKTWLIGYKDGKLICSKPYDGIYKGVNCYGYNKYLIKMSDVENDSVEATNDCRLFFVNNDMTLTTYDDNDNFNYNLNLFDRYKVE